MEDLKARIDRHVDRLVEQSGLPRHNIVTITVSMLWDEIRAAIEEERQKSKEDMAHSRRSIKQACLFAVEGTAIQHGVGPLYYAGFSAGLEAAVKALTLVEVD